MDTDHTNTPEALDWSRSIRILIERLAVRENRPSLDQPGPRAYIKGFTTRFFHLLGTFLFLLLFFLAVLSLQTLNPSFQNLTQNSMIQGSIASFHRPNHESVAGNYMHLLNRRESWFPFLRISNNFWSYFLTLNLFWWNPRGFIGLQRFFFAL